MSIPKLSSPKINVQASFSQGLMIVVHLLNANISADKPESEFIAWIIYSCDGGGKDESNFDEAGKNNYFCILK